MKTVKGVAYKKFATSIWYVFAFVTLTAGFLFKVNVHAQAQQSGAERIFKIENDKTAKRIELGHFIDKDFGYGSATIQLTLDSAGSGEVTSARMYQDAPRRGKLGFADSLIVRMITWRYTKSVTGYLLVSVAIPSANERNEGKLESISVDLSQVNLPDSGVTISMAKRDADATVAQDGFFDSVFVTGAPAHIIDRFEKDVGQKVGEIWDNLGPVFKVLFAVTFIAWLFLLVLSIGDVRRLWEPAKKRISLGFFSINIPIKRFKSRPAQAVERIWVDAIINTQFSAALFHRNGLSEVHLQGVREAVTQAQTAEEVESAVNESKLGEMLGKDFFYETNGVVDPKTLEILRSRIKSTLEDELARPMVTEETKTKASTVLNKIDDCRDESSLRKLLSKNGFPAEKMIESGPSERTRRPADELKKELERIVARLHEMQAALNLTGNSNGSGTESQSVELPAEKEQDYERFLWKYFGEPRVDEALRICNENWKYPLFQIFGSGLNNHRVNRNHWWSSQEIDRSIDRTAAVKFEDRRGVLDWLWAIGSLSPMFGLGGTVWGISQAFGKISNVTDTKQLMQLLAGDINIALATTIVGLIIGVFAFITYYYSKYFLDRDAAKIEEHLTNITNYA